MVAKNVSKDRWKMLVSGIVIIIIVSIILIILGKFPFEITSWIIVRSLTSLIVLGLIYYFIVRKMINKK